MNRKPNAALYTFMHVPYEVDLTKRPIESMAIDVKWPRFCQVNGLYAERIYRDFDGTVPAGEREELRKLIEDIENKKIDKVVIAGIEYVSDDGEEALTIIQGIESMGAEVIPMDGCYDKKPEQQTPLYA